MRLISLPQWVIYRRDLNRPRINTRLLQPAFNLSIEEPQEGQFIDGSFPSESDHLSEMSTSRRPRLLGARHCRWLITCGAPLAATSPSVYCSVIRTELMLTEGVQHGNCPDSHETTWLTAHLQRTYLCPIMLVFYLVGVLWISVFTAQKWMIWTNNMLVWDDCWRRLNVLKVHFIS